MSVASCSLGMMFLSGPLPWPTTKRPVTFPGDWCDSSEILACCRIAVCGNSTLIISNFTDSSKDKNIE